MHEDHKWTFFTNHAHVLVCLSRDPAQPLREVASSIGITERAVQRIVSELEAEKFLVRERVGRQNHYTLDTTTQLRHPLEEHRTIGDLLEIVVPQ